MGTDRASPRVTPLPPDAVHRTVKPGTAVVRLETTADRQGVRDGAWWPRSRDITAELPTLISARTELLGPIARVGLDASAWEELPTRLVLGEHVVRGRTPGHERRSASAILGRVRCR